MPLNIKYALQVANTQQVNYLGKKVQISANENVTTKFHIALNGLNAWTSGEILASAV